MPELPEVEVVRRGLHRWVSGRRVARVEVLHPRPVRWHVPGEDDFVARLLGARVQDAVRRGKYLWLELDSGEGLLAHLGMSGQLLVAGQDTERQRHLRVVLGFDDGGPELRFVDQRMFGGLAVVPLVSTADGLPGGTGGGGAPSKPYLPPEVAHIARDPLDACFDEATTVERLRSKRTGVKRALLDQTLVSGIGNIYADEALWRARLHYARPTDTLTRPAARALLGHARDVMSYALGHGGTSFDALYVNVNGESGYFERSLAVYRKQSTPCQRCGATIVRERFMNRYSHFCPVCQPKR